VFRWVQRYAPELDKRCRPHLTETNDSYGESGSPRPFLFRYEV
jgi:hypothetical protein